MPVPPAKSPRNRQPVPAAPTAAPEVVDPVWLLKALGAVLVLGLFCAYLTICLFFYYGQSRFILHPSRTVAQTPASLPLPFTPVRFGPDASGQPQLAGWWIPSDTRADPTVLLLHSETGTMSDALPAARALHDARLNVLLFDYRGYGESGGDRPGQSLMQNDASSALQYLADLRHVPPSTLLVYGSGLGASLAVKLCTEHPGLAGLILESADGDTLSRVQADQRSRVIPIALLFHERFPLADPLSTLHTPKLLLSHTNGNPPVYAERAASPKLTVELGQHADATQLTEAVRRFLDTYVPHPAQVLQPSH